MRLVRLLEALLGVRVLVRVGMELAGQLAIGLLDLGLDGGLRNAEDLVVVLVLHRSLKPDHERRASNARRRSARRASGRLACRRLVAAARRRSRRSAASRRACGLAAGGARRRAWRSSRSALIRAAGRGASMSASASTWSMFSTGTIRSCVAHLLRHVDQVPLVPLRDEDRLHAGEVRRQQLRLQAADRAGPGRGA